MIELSDTPAEALHKLINDPSTKRAICERLGVPENVEIDADAFRRAGEVCKDAVRAECPASYYDMTVEEFAARHDPAVCFVCKALREPYPIIEITKPGK